MLCVRCKKNQAIKTYEQVRNGKTEYAYYCLKCDEFLQERERTYCPYCGTTAAKFQRTKLVGCEKCYQALRIVVDPVVEKMQGTTPHMGKRAYVNKQERIKQRCEELSTLAKKRYSENDDKGAGKYETAIDILRSGMEENFVWKITRKFNP